MDEIKPFGTQVFIIEPGFFSTSWLASVLSKPKSSVWCVGRIDRDMSRAGRLEIFGNAPAGYGKSFTKQV